MHADTKQIIARQLFAFLGYKKIEDITVKDLVDACHISRQTFYYHFHDINRMPCIGLSHEIGYVFFSLYCKRFLRHLDSRCKLISLLFHILCRFYGYAGICVANNLATNVRSIRIE